MGERVRGRLEDPPLITGSGRYLDDMSPPRCLHAGFVRSPYAHATVGAIDAEAARAIQGVVGVYSGVDLGLDRPMPNMHPDPSREPGVQGFPLAPEEVCYVGEPVAVVVAEDRYTLADALSAVFVDHEPLPASTDPVRALDPDAAPVHTGSETNLATTLRGGYGDVDGVFASAQHTARLDLHQHRGAVASMETRGVLADFTDEPIVWSSTQSPHGLQNLVSSYLGVDELRVITPDVGGGFGPKGSVYPEEYVVPALARTLGRPVKWVESRREHFLTTNQQRDQIHRLEVAFDDSGLLLGLRGRVIHDNGAYVPYGYLLPLTGMRLLPGPYVLPAMDLTIDVVYTNLVPTSPIRGAARPNAVFAIERAMDTIARSVGLTQADVRYRNFATAEIGHEVPLPSRTGEPIRYDGGDYRRTLDLALHVADTAGFAERRIETEERGLRRGLGLASYVEDTGTGPSEGARVGIDQDGQVQVDVGVSSQGQGHTTVFAQLVSDALGVLPRSVVVVSGDTGNFPTGKSTVASRTAVTAGPAVRTAATEVANVIKKTAAEMLEAAEADLRLDDGMVEVVGVTGMGVSLKEVAAHLHQQGLGAELTAHEDVPFGSAAYAFGTNVVEVIVDPETGLVEVVDYSVAHDCGTVLNPMIVAGQIEGGVVHGLGNALLERVATSEDGQPLVTSFIDYRIMGASEVPLIRQTHTETPSPTNLLGARGAGEGGTLPAMAAVAAAVEDALSPWGVVVDRYPLQPEVVRRLMKDADGPEESVD